MSVAHGLEPVIEKRYVNPIADWQRIKQKLSHYAAVLDPLDGSIEHSLAETNVAIILRLAEDLLIRTPMAFDYPTTLTGTERLIDLCRHYGASSYVLSANGLRYVDAAQFERAGIALDVLPSPDKTHTLDVLCPPSIPSLSAAIPTRNS
jgi:hypothetical protein